MLLTGSAPGQDAHSAAGSVQEPEPQFPHLYNRRGRGLSQHVLKQGGPGSRCGTAGATQASPQATVQGAPLQVPDTAQR